MAPRVPRAAALLLPAVLAALPRPLAASRTSGCEARACDGFGVAMLYGPFSGGRSWASRWEGAGATRSIRAVAADTLDPAAQLRGSGSLAVDGASGVASMAGSPRYYVGDGGAGRAWDNVEVTAYGRRMSDHPASMRPYTGFTIVTRSSHDVYRQLPCAALGYYARIYFSTGEAAFQKEFYHSSVGGPVYSRSRRVPSGLMDEDGRPGVPRGEWVGVKMVVRTAVGAASVHLELYLDTTNGTGGGAWELVHSLVDTGSNWPATKAVPPECGWSQAQAVLRPGNVTFLRTDGVERLDWSRFSVREIGPADTAAGESLAAGVGLSAVALLAAALVLDCP